MIEVKNLVKKYENFLAVDDISFQVNRGDILGFLGPNGAGKSTTMKILSGFIDATEGEAIVGGKSVRSEGTEVRKQIGYLPESAPSYKDLTVEEFLSFISEIRGFYGEERKSRIDEIIERTFLQGVRHQTIDTLSKGFRQRVGFAQALIHNPPVLILDEPTDGLDPNQKHEVRKMIADMGKDKAIILSTHILEEMEAVCNRAIIIDKGKIVTDSTPAELLQRSKSHEAVRIRFSEFSPEVREALESLKKSFEIAESGNEVTVFKNETEKPFSAAQEILKNASGFVESMEVLKGKFDEVFRDLTEQKSPA